MAWQLVFTSAPRGLALGRSGFCTVARHPEIRDLLAGEIERFSVYDHHPSRPVIHAHRIIEIRDTRYHILSRTVDAGLDYTNRTNHLAHHLVCTEEEIARSPNPALILASWKGWLDRWEGPPRSFGPEDRIDLSTLALSCSRQAPSWAALTGDAGDAGLLLDNSHIAGCLIFPPASEQPPLLTLFAETLELLRTSDGRSTAAWQIPFTTRLQASDQPHDFRWRGTAAGGPGSDNTASWPVVDLSNPASLPASSNAWAECARTGGFPPASAALPAFLPPGSKKKPATSSPGTSTTDTSGENPDASRRAVRMGWIIAAIAVLGGGLGFFILSILLREPPAAPPPPPTPPEVRPGTEFPTTLPTPPPAPAADPVAPVTPPPAPPPPPVADTPPPSPKEVFLGTDGLPKIPTLILAGDMNSAGILVPSPQETVVNTLLASPSVRCRVLSRQDGRFSAAPLPEGTLLNREGPRTIYYDTSRRAALEWDLPGGTAVLRSRPLTDPYLLLRPEEGREWQILVVNTSHPSISSDTALFLLSRSLLEPSRTSGQPLAPAPELWTLLRKKLLFPPGGHWVLRHRDLVPPADLTPDEDGLVRWMTAPPELAPGDAAKLRELQTRLEEIGRVLAARDLLFAPDRPYHRAGSLLLGWIYENHTTMHSLLADFLEMNRGSTYLQRPDIHARISRGPDAYLKSLEPFRTFTTYLESRRIDPAQATPAHYQAYIRSVLAEAEIQRGTFEGPPALFEKFRWPEFAAGFSKDTPRGLDADQPTRLRQHLLSAWNTLFNPASMEEILPFLTSKQPPTELEAEALSLRGRIEVLNTPTAPPPPTKDLAAHIILEWVHGGTRIRIAEFPQP
jgi:hypothetical protein